MSALRHFNPEGWGKLETLLDELFASDFEKGMERLPEIGWNLGGMYKTDLLFPLQKAMGLYFFSFVPNVTSLYVKLAKKIKDSGWCGVLVSLNYERLLQISLRFNDLKPVIGTRAENAYEIELCLPHGCCNLFCEHAFTATYLHEMINEIFDGPLVEINCPTNYLQQLNKCRAPPVMSFFTEDKISATGQIFFLQPQRRRYEEAVLTAERVAIIGVRVRSHDTHIWEPLAKTSAQLIYCSGLSGAQEFKRWKDEQRPHSNDVIMDGYFAEHFEELCDYLGFNRQS
jgi:hypothetical protein